MSRRVVRWWVGWRQSRAVKRCVGWPLRFGAGVLGTGLRGEREGVAAVFQLSTDLPVYKNTDINNIWIKLVHTILYLILKCQRKTNNRNVTKQGEPCV